MQAKSAAPRTYPKILLVEDEMITAQHIRKTLTRFGYKVVGLATTGTAALKDAERNRPDLLVADIGLNGVLDGIDVAAQVRELWGIPTVFLTAYADSETMTRARLVEPYGYLVKPFGEEELHATIEIALQQKKLLQERQLQTENNLSTIARTKEELYTLAAKLVFAQEEERQRIARELHDDVGQRLALLQIEVGRLAAKLSAAVSQDVAAHFDLIGSRIDELCEDIRTLSHNLHPAVLEHLGLVPAMRQLARDFEQRFSIRTRFSARDMRPGSAGQSGMTLYRITQEALHNIAKHADAKSVEIALVSAPAELHLSIRDVGRGFDPRVARSGGLGLISMRQRAELVHGSFAIHSEPGVGTQINVCVPIVEGKSESDCQ
jgi:signal transduction histidine kinase